MTERDRLGGRRYDSIITFPTFLLLAYDLLARDIFLSDGRGKGRQKKTKERNHRTTRAVAPKPGKDEARYGPGTSGKLARAGGRLV